MFSFIPAWLRTGCAYLIAIPLGLVALIAFGILVSSGASATMEETIMLSVLFVATGAPTAFILHRIWGGGSASSMWTGPVRGAVQVDPADEDASPDTVTESGKEREPVDADIEGEASWDVEWPDDLPEGTPPWTYREEWADGRIATDRGTFKSTTGGGMMLVLGIAMLGIGAVIGALMWTDGELASLGLAAFWGVAGIGALALGGYRVARQYKYGETVFDMNPVPGQLGGTVQGVLHTGVPPDAEPEGGFTVTLSCLQRRVRVRRSREGTPSTSVRRTLQWRDEKVFRGRPSRNQTGIDIPIQFDVPADLPPATPEKKPNRYQWVVTVSANVPGVDYNAVMEIPVYQVVETEEVPTVPGVKEVNHSYDAPTSRAISMNRLPGRGRQFQFGPLLQWGRAVGLTAVVLGLVALMVFMGSSQLFAGFIVLVFALAVGWGAYDAWTYTSTVKIEEGEICVRAGPFGRRTITCFSCADLEEARVESHGYSNQIHLYGDPDAIGKQKTGGKHMLAQTVGRLFRGLSGRVAQDRQLQQQLRRMGEMENQVVAARMLPYHREAEWIARQIEEEAGRQARYGR